MASSLCIFAMSMKRYFSILIILIITVASLHKTIVFAYYEIDKEYIIENLCVNADEPEMGCEGKCYLMNKANDDKAVGIIVDLLKSIKEFNAQISHQLVLNIPCNSESIINIEFLKKLELGYAISLIKPPINKS